MTYSTVRGWLRKFFLAGVLLLAGPVLLPAQHRPAAAPDKLGAALRLAAAVPAVRISVPDPARFREWARQALPGVRVQAEAGQPKLLVLSGLDRAGLEMLLASPLVTFVDVPNRPVRDERQLNRANPVVNGVAAVHRRYPALTGQGLTVSVKENPFDPTDIDFKGRLVEVAAVSTPSEHATTMATLIAGGGNSAPSGKGAAWQARLTSADYANLLPDDATELNRRGVSVQNHSYGTGIENYYGLEARAYDAQARQNPALLHVFSSGNSGNQTSTTGRYQALRSVANLTGQFKMSKNTLSVGATNAQGAVAPLSSRGPAHDGRVKPELVAFGDDGSSDAAALVSGISLLTQQAYRNQNGGALPPSSLVKAALINSADDTGRPEVDFEAGFGQVDAVGAVRTMLDGHYRTGTVAQDQAEQFILSPPPGTRKIKVTLTWTDPEAAANAPQALVNDLDLQVVALNNGRDVGYSPWTLSSYPHLDSLALPARRRPDHLNTVEQVTIANPTSDLHVVVVRGFNVAAGSQAFSVAYEFEREFEWLNPLTTRSLQAGTPEPLRWQWAGPATPARLEYKPVGAGSWQLVASSLDLSQRGYAWLVPNVAALVQLRLVSADTTYVSDTVAVARAVALQVGYACPEEGLLYWNWVPGATGYQVYRLGATHLQPFQLTIDTTLVLSKAQQEVASQYAVEPVLGPLRGTRSTTLDLVNTGLNCYIRSFVPRLAVADTAQLLLELGSTLRLQSIHLQRWEQGGFRTIQTLSSALALGTEFTDLTATPGRNEYRVMLQDANGRTSFSQQEVVFVVRRNDLLVFPVPVKAGELLRVIGEPGEPLHLRLFDSLGRLLRETTVEGSINSLNTSGLRAGVYLLRARTRTGSTITRRIVVL